ERPRAIAPRVGQRLEQPIERAALAEEEDFVLAAEVVIEIRRREVGGDGDLAHPGGGKAAGAEDAGGGAHDRDPAAVGASRTAVRKLNHRSIVAVCHGASTAGDDFPPESGGRSGRPPAFQADTGPIWPF